MLLRVSINGQHDYINLGKRIKRIHYDEINKCVKAGITGFGTTNAFIVRQKGIIDAIVEDFERKQEIITIHRVKEVYVSRTGKEKSISLFDFIEQTLDTKL